MISVQNLLQRLSGSKLKLAVCLVAISILFVLALRHAQGKQYVEAENIDFQLAGNQQASILPVSPVAPPKNWKIALILPFHLDSINFQVEQEPIPVESWPALYFYEGMLLALDSLKYMGMQVNLFVFDSKTDTTEVKKILEKLDNLEVDAVIGPIVTPCVDLVKKHFKNNPDVITISPLLQDTSEHIICPNHVTMNPSPAVHADILAKYLLLVYKGSNFVTIRPASPLNKKEQSIFDNFNNTLGNAQIPGLSFPVQRHDVPGATTISKYFTSDTNKQNVIFVPSTDEAYLYQLFNSLNILSSHYKFTVFGIQDWLNFNTLDAASFVKFNVHLSTNYWVDFSHPSVVKFRNKFRNKFKIEPNKYAYQGFDILLYMGRGFLAHHKHLEEFTTFFWRGLSTNYQLEPVMEGDSISRYENEQISIIRFKNGEILKVR